MNISLIITIIMFTIAIFPEMPHYAFLFAGIIFGVITIIKAMLEEEKKQPFSPTLLDASPQSQQDAKDDQE